MPGLSGLYDRPYIHQGGNGVAGLVPKLKKSLRFELLDVERGKYIKIIATIFPRDVDTFQVLIEKCWARRESGLEEGAVAH